MMRSSQTMNLKERDKRPMFIMIQRNIPQKLQFKLCEVEKLTFKIRYAQLFFRGTFHDRFGAYDAHILYLSIGLNNRCHHYIKSMPGDILVLIVGT